MNDYLHFIFFIIWCNIKSYIWHYIIACNVWLKTVAFIFVYLENMFDWLIDWLIDNNILFLYNLFIREIFTFISLILGSLIMLHCSNFAFVSHSLALLWLWFSISTPMGKRVGCMFLLSFLLLVLLFFILICCPQSFLWMYVLAFPIPLFFSYTIG